MKNITWKETISMILSLLYIPVLKIKNEAMTGFVARNPNDLLFTSALSVMFNHMHMFVDVEYSWLMHLYGFWSSGEGLKLNMRAAWCCYV